jgi:hypothetical protein
MAAVVVLDISDITNPTWRSTFQLPVDIGSGYGLNHLAFLPNGAASLSVDVLGPYIVNITTDAPTNIFQGIFQTNSKYQTQCFYLQFEVTNAEVKVSSSDIFVGSEYDGSLSRYSLYYDPPQLMNTYYLSGTTKLSLC